MDSPFSADAPEGLVRQQIGQLAEPGRMIRWDKGPHYSQKLLDFLC
jgi:hypothetical protein